MDWLEITAPVSPEQLNTLTDALEALGTEGLVINDEASTRAALEDNPTAWDFVDDTVFDALRGGSNVQFYLEDSPGGREELARIRAALPSQTFEVRAVRDEDWLNNWKQYFKPIEIGEKLLIAPAWEPDPPSAGRTILRIEPQNAFGTGDHASTRMCLQELQNHPAGHVLDLGCGSGILAVAALLLGCPDAVCCDISLDADAVCRYNARINELDEDRLRVYTGDILSGGTLDKAAAGRQYDIVFANIIADVIIALAPRVGALMKPDGVFICSGIIDGRQDNVRAALISAGLECISERQSDGWHMLAARLIPN